MIKFKKIETKLKLESLVNTRIQNINEIVGGSSGMGMEETAETCKCVKYSGCSVYIDSDGGVAMTGGTWYED